MQILFWLSIGLDRRTPSEHLLTAIVEALYKEGHTVHILQKNTGGDKGEMPPPMAELGVTTTRIESKPAKSSNLIARYLADIQYIRKCKAWLKKNRQYDRIFMQSSNVAGLQVRTLKKTQKNIPITFNVQDIFPENALYTGTFSAKSPAYKVLSAIQKYAYRHVNRIITISEDMKDQLVALGAKEENVDVVYNWSYQDEPYDLAQLDYTRVAPLFDQDKFNVVYAGNIGRMQNVETVIQAAAKMQQHQDICFHIFGEGVYKSKLTALAEELKTDNLVFHSMLETKDAPALYASADINIIPLAKDIYKTALPSKTATCLACQKPIIFAIGKDSRFGRQAEKAFPSVTLTDCDSQSLADAIVAIKAKAAPAPGSPDAFRPFAATGNSGEYATIICQNT